MIVADLTGQRLPSLYLPSTDATKINPGQLTGVCVVVIYPWTGRPGFANPENWDLIPGAHGSTPQLLAYSSLYEHFQNLSVKLFGLSQLSTDWQQDFVARNALAFPLLSDAGTDFAKALNLATIETGGQKYLQRRTLVARDGIILQDRTVMTSPETDAQTVLAYLQALEQ